MSTTLDNFRGPRTWRLAGPILVAGALPLLLVGYTLRPAWDYRRLGEELVEARERARLAQDLDAFFERFGDEEPPIENLREVQAELVRRLPYGFQPTAFYEACLAAARQSGVRLDSISPSISRDLELPVGVLSIHEQTVTVKGRTRPEGLRAFLAALHERGRPVCVRSCRLHALSTPGTFDFQVDLGAFHVSPPTNLEGASEDS